MSSLPLQVPVDRVLDRVVAAVDGDADAKYEVMLSLRGRIDWPSVTDRVLQIRPTAAQALRTLRTGRPPSRRGAADSSTAEGDLTQDGLALEMGEDWVDARFVASWGKWLFFDGVAWRFDETLEHMTRARTYLRGRADELGAALELKAKELRRADTVAKIISLARSNTKQSATVNQWDTDDFLIGTPGGTVDLRTGDLRVTWPDDYITKTTAVAPAPPGTRAPLWTWVLDRITGQNLELQGYLQRYFGMGLTGCIREHVFAFGHGTGANGKGVVLNTVKGVLDEYAMVIPTEMLMVQAGDRHPTELARLRGVRLAIGSETEEGKRWAESRIKSLTGGDPIAARFMRQDFFEFTPKFKLFLVGNHRPSLRGVDEAMRRRLHLVPFTVTIPPDERDPELSDKLKAEWPAILRWMIDGCLEWQRVGLLPPEAVRAATDEYLSAEDAVSLWLEECVDLEPNAWESTGSLFASWRRWTERSGEFTGTQKRFAQILQERGFEPKRQGGTGLRGYRGILLNDSESERRWTP
jgi:putative DNA primase/helicase